MNTPSRSRKRTGKGQMALTVNSTKNGWTQYNLNDYVRFKLTDEGRNFIAELNRSHPVYSYAPISFRPDADGWIEDQLWNFAAVFGPTLKMGFGQNVETMIELKRWKP